jgi:hypothetical protein
VSTTDDRAAENGPDPGVFTITRTGQTSDPLTVTFQLLGSATNGTDYETLATSATIPAGAATTTVTVTPRADLDVEGNESVILSLSPGADYTIGSQGLAGLTITDSVVVTVAAIDPDASELGLDPGVFTFTRSGGDQSAPLVLTFARDGTASNAADFENIGFTVTIPANQSSVAVTIAPLADNALEGPETVLLTINPSNAYTVGPPSGPVTIADDPVIVTLSAADAAASEAGPDPGVFAFTRTGGNPAAQLNVFFALGGTAANNGDFLLIGGNIIIPAGQLSATLTITPRQDNNVEAAETVVVTLEPRPTYAIGSPSTATITIADDPAVVTVVATDPDASESGANPGVHGDPHGREPGGRANRDRLAGRHGIQRLRLRLAGRRQLRGDDSGQSGVGDGHSDADPGWRRRGSRNGDSHHQPESGVHRRCSGFGYRDDSGLNFGATSMRLGPPARSN